MIRGFGLQAETTLRMKIDDIIAADREVEFGSITDNLINLLGSDEIHNQFYYDPDFDVKKILKKITFIKEKIKLIEESVNDFDQCEIIKETIEDISSLENSLKTY